MVDAPAPGGSGYVSPTHNPQVARATLTLADGARACIEFGPDTSYGRSTWLVPSPPGGGDVSILVAGMTAGSRYHMRGRIQERDGSWHVTPDAMFMTGPLPTSILPSVSAAPAPGGRPSPGVELVNVIDPIGISVVADLHGNILWYYDNAQDKGWGGYAFPIKPLPNGNFVASITNLYMEGFKTPNSVLREIDLAGDTVQGPNGPKELTLAALNAALANLRTPQGSIVTALTYSHDVAPLPNGHTLLIVQEQRNVWLTDPPGPGEFLVLGDAIVDLDESYDPVWVWSTFDNLDVNRHPMGFDAADGYDWTHCNTVLLAPDGNILLSSRHQNWILKIRYEGGTGDGAVLWKLGYQGSFTLQGGDDTDWFFAQHYANVLDFEGPFITRLSVFDNGNDRCFATPQGCTKSSPPAWSRGLIMDVDERAAAVKVERSFPLNFYSWWGGNVVALPNGDVEICASEPVPIGQPIPPTDTPSQVVELSGSETVWSLTVNTGGAYRSYRLPSLYPGVVWDD